MTCMDRERSIALYAGGELDGSESWELEQHLATCSECSEVLDELHSARLYLGQPLEGEVELAANVRAAVIATLRRRRMLSRIAVAAAVTIAIGLAALTRMASQPVAALEHRWTLPPAPALTEVKRTARIPRVRRERALHRRTTPAAVEREQIVVKLVTDDPDIVILWLGG